MKEVEVFPHLDVHNEPEGITLLAMKDTDSKQGISVISADSQRLTHEETRDPQPFLESSSKKRNQPKLPMERLPQLNYSLLNDNALRKKLASLGIPTHGQRGLMVRRHTEWVNLVNSNCDSKKPKGKRELLLELDVWERSQGRQIANHGLSGSSVMDKDFDGAEWASKHGSNFQKLITEARKPYSRKNVTDTSEAQGDEMVKDEGRVENRLTGDENCNEQPLSANLTSSALSNGPSRYPNQSGKGAFVDLGASV